MFYFSLIPIEDILEWGEINFLSLSLGFYHFKLNKTEIFRYSDEILADWKNTDRNLLQIKYACPYPDYTIQMLSENLSWHINSYLQPVPAELHHLIDTQEHCDQWLHKLDLHETAHGL